MNETRVHNGDWLRLFLALHVVFGHCLDYSTGTYFGVVSPVPVFLSISGFFVLQSLERRGVKSFVIRRVSRIIPALCVSFVMVALLGFDFKQPIIEYLTFGIKGRQINSPLWSLGMEEIAYFLMAILFWLGFYKQSKLCIGLAIILALADATVVPHHSPGTVKYLLIWPPFFIGSGLYVAREKLERIKHLALPAFLIGAVPIMIQSTNPFAHPSPGFAFAYIGGISLTAFGLLLAALTWKQLPKIPADMSYGFYIYHYPIMKFIGNKFGNNGYLAVLLPTLLATAVVASLSWFLVEKRALAWSAKITTKPVLDAA